MSSNFFNSNWFVREVRTNTFDSLNSIDKKLLYIPKFNTIAYGKKSLRYLCPKLWNETFKSGVIQVSPIKEKNISVSKIKTIHNFKNALKRHYLFTYSAEWLKMELYLFIYPYIFFHLNARNVPLLIIFILFYYLLHVQLTNLILVLMFKQW